MTHGILRIIISTVLYMLPALANSAELVGSMSCASATCHGGVVGRGPAWNQSFNISRNSDPHVKAGLVLYEPTSQAIVKALVPTATDRVAYDKVLRQKCISCHLTVEPKDLVSNELLPPVQIFEGVSCESCHGAASSWLDAHVLASWKGPQRFESRSPNETDTASRMLDTESLVGRSEACMRCHVGSRTADGMVRDMNHDLIAAGHPALRFDLLRYLDPEHQGMPHHWDDNGLVEQAFRESPFRVRKVSRLVGMAAAARLSMERAQDSLRNRAVAAESLTGSEVPWPELADFDCFACHQTLSSQAYRLPKMIDGQPSLQISSGLPLWNAWYAAPLAAVAEPDDPIWKLRPKPGAQADWIAISKSLAENFARLAKWEAEAAPPTAPFAAVRLQLSRRAPSDWHSAAAMYLELDAATKEALLRPELRELGQKAEQVLNEEVAPLLQFEQSDSPGASRRSSPGMFDPRKFRDATLQALKSVDEQP